MSAAIRSFFAERDFIEVETSILQISPGNEAHIAGFCTELLDPSGTASKLYLHASPEFAAKKLLAAGERRLFTLAHVFRNGERGPLHHPEFTMLEWYRAEAGYESLMEDCTALLAKLASAAGAKRLSFRGASADPFAPPERLSVVEAFQCHAHIDLGATFSASETDRAALAAAARAAQIRVVADDTWSDIFSKILSQLVEPQLGHGRPTILTDYPASEAALARLRADEPRFAERFELYACGVELANGFGELRDAAEQRRRFITEMDERQRLHGEAYPIDEDFLAALALMPEASGIALGFDRLVMLATGAHHIEQVLWTPVAPVGSF